MVGKLTDFKYGDLKPSEVITKLAIKNEMLVTDKAFQEYLDEQDGLKTFRNQFLIPKKETYLRATVKEGDCIPFCNHGLGLQPQKTGDIIKHVLNDWACLGNESRFSGYMPAAQCDENISQDMASLVGAYTDEVAVMNGLTVNIHLLLASFYQPTTVRHKVLVEEHAFPADHLAIRSQINAKGYNPDVSMIIVSPRKGEDIWRMSDILELIEKDGSEIALVLLPSVHFYTGQLFDMEAITKTAHSKGCLVGIDLAHAVGNAEIYLHEWQVDFAYWCNYKYVNAACGSIGGAFIHRNNKSQPPALLGWWGQKIKSKLALSTEQDPKVGVAGYIITTPPPLLVAPLRASLDVFKQTSIRQLREKSFLLTGYMECLLTHYLSRTDDVTPYIQIITPSDFKQRGCQFSLKSNKSVHKICDELHKKGVICDVSVPDVLRVSPVPLYNTFADVFNFVNILRDIMGTI